jgi:hypothetical protein
MARKPKTAEPSLRAKLSAAFLEAFEADFAAHGVNVIEKLRERSPEKYAELAGKLIMTTEPPQDGFESAQTIQELGLKLLKSVGCPEGAATDDMIAQAIERHDQYVADLTQIAAGH